ncbi:uncharacterized protein LOC128235694 [Mya arenaria]|uniref:uncharacterized protein LOC128235694 n=1 Tax=Mya arenaria TaxID=6604 RepID=UPI0022E2B858|nr:uncharacterized protein LOC128235694 [Mya arenaria]
MDGLSRRNVTCQVSNIALQTPYEVHGVLCSVDNQSDEKDIHAFVSTFRFPVSKVLIGAAVLCVLCILFVIGRYIFLKRRRDNTVTTIVIVENHSVFETVRRRPEDRSSHLYDEIQSSNTETTTLQHLGGVPSSAIENQNAPPLLDMEGIQVFSNENVSHYDYADTPSAQSDRRTIAPDTNYIHAI